IKERRGNRMKSIAVGTATRLDINVDSGGGSVIGLATIGNATFLSRPLNDRTSGSSLLRAVFSARPEAVPSVTTVVPVISGSSAAGTSSAYRTAIGLVAQ